MGEQWFFNSSSPSPLKWLNIFSPSITFSHHLVNIIFSFFPPSISSWKTKHIFSPQHPSFLEHVDFFLVPYNQPLLCNGWIFCKTKHFYNSWTFILSPITTLSFRMDGTFSFYLYSRMGVLSFVPYNHPLFWNGWTIFWKTLNTCSCGVDKHFSPLI